MEMKMKMGMGMGIVLHESTDLHSGSRIYLL